VDSDIKGFIFEPMEIPIIAEISLVVHPTPDHICRIYFQVDTDNDPEEDFRYFGIDQAGEETEVTWKEMLDGMQSTGCWGFAATKQKEVHLWVDSTFNRRNLLALLAHEIGHIVEKEYLKVKAEGGYSKEEKRADLFAAAALLADEWLQQIQDALRTTRICSLN
jgi:hypothetical protein